MTSYVALLRGVNVGGHNKLPMNDLRTLVEAQGAEDVSTYIQSGNIVFRLTKGGAPTFQKQLAGAIEREFGFKPGVMVLDAKTFKTILKNNPFAKDNKDPSKLQVMFLMASATAAALKKVEAMLAKDERIKAKGKAVYFDAPSGIGRSKAAEVLARGFKEGTMRNWRTCLRLEEILAEIS
jgi:uncharacterized protein (DUF1697 family)